MVIEPVSLVFCLSLCFCFGVPVLADEASPIELPEKERTGRALKVLRLAFRDVDVWNRVRGAEALLSNGSVANIKEIFLKELQNTGSDYRIGVWRVLTRAHQKDPLAAREYINKIRDVFLDHTATDRDAALEALGKLEYSERLDEILRVAKEGKGSLQARARWILANSGDPRDEAALAELLDSVDANVRASTAYALRYLKSLQSSTLAKLEWAADKEPYDSRSRAYEISALYVHTAMGRKAEIKERLLKYTSGNTEQRAELCAALGVAGEDVDFPLL